MINISKSSWHYKLVNKKFNPSKNFCNYFWQLIWTLTLKLKIFIIIGILIYLYGLISLAETQGIKTGILTFEDIYSAPKSLAIASFISAILAWIITMLLILATFFFVIDKLYSKFKGFNMLIRFQEFLKLVWQYIKTTKKKICPRVKFTN